ncbi:TadE/TadG family type IV pilus assembly protein [Sporichthya polymorpha]|uniref:TadE/TadG family type IV pilus assembly protein n=1 Tax=Sporichthya polymorpha TaxID=35751 RepID=UPI0003729232|nr:TadE/TadG family type IV pilus assembly protein [Sporichthya polymorpha]
MTSATSPDTSPASNPGSGADPDTGMGSAADRERGSIAVELVILTPLLIVLLLLVVGLGRIAHTHAQVEGAAADAARSASLATSPATAQHAGEQAARAYLGDRSCRHLDIDIDTAGLRPGGVVTAHLRCTVSLAGLGLAGFPGTRTFSATVQVPIDLHASR